MTIEELPHIYLDAGVIPAELLFKDKNYPDKIKVAGRYWYLNLDSHIPFYEKVKENA